jgi:hypothetical protein
VLAEHVIVRELRACAIHVERHAVVFILTPNDDAIRNHAADDRRHTVVIDVREGHAAVGGILLAAEPCVSRELVRERIGDGHGERVA